MSSQPTAPRRTSPHTWPEYEPLRSAEEVDPEPAADEMRVVVAVVAEKSLPDFVAASAG